MQFIRYLGCDFQSDVNLASAWEPSPAENHNMIYACNACHPEWDTGDFQGSKRAPGIGVPVLPGWSRTASPTSAGGAEGVPQSIGVCWSAAHLRWHCCVRHCVLKCAHLSCTAYERVCWHIELCVNTNGAFIFKSGPLSWGLMRNLIIRLLPATAYPVNAPCLVAGVCSLRWWLWRGLVFF